MVVLVNKRKLSLFMVLVLLLSLFTPAYAAKAVKVKSVKMNKTKVTLDVSKTLTLKATIKPTNATDKSVKWSSSDKKVATVDENGKVTPLKAGKTKITAKSTNGKKATCTVTVTAKVKSVTFAKTSLSLEVGKKETLKYTVLPSSAKNKAVTFKTSKKAVATVDKKGKVTAKKAGKTTITITTKDGKKTAKCTVTVTPKAVLATSVSLNMANVTLAAGKTQQLTATIKPSGATDKTITWSSSNSAIAKVSTSGLVTAVSAGSATITAKTSNGKIATCTVTVTTTTPSTVAPTSVSLSSSNVALEVGKTHQLTATVAPTNATDKGITWTSSNTLIAKVSSSGLVTAVSPGTVTITAATSNGKTKTCTVRALDAEDMVIEIVNQRRAEANLPALAKNATLMAACDVRAKELETLFSHTRPDGSAWSTAAPGVAYGENIAYGYGSAEAVMSGWMNSTGHRENILRSTFGSIGVGMYKGSNGALYWVQLFGWKW